MLLTFIFIIFLPSPINTREIIVQLTTKCNGSNPIGQEISIHTKRIMWKSFSSFYEFSEFDICDEALIEGYETITSVLLDLLLDQRFRKPDNQDEYRILGIMTYLPDKLLRFTLDILKLTNIPVFSINHVRYKVGFPEMNLFFKAQPLSYLLDKMQWEKILILEVSVYPTAKPILDIEHIIREHKSLNIRYIFSRYDVRNNVKNKLIFEKLLKESPQVTILVGNLAGKFMTDAYDYGIRNQYWVLFTNYFREGHNVGLSEYIVFASTYARATLGSLFY